MVLPAYGGAARAGTARPPPATVAAPRDEERAVSLQERVVRARTDDRAVLLEGVHALKHAVRFGATVRTVATPDPGRLEDLLAELAPDVLERLSGPDAPTPQAIDDGAWRALTAGALPSPCLAIADRPVVDPVEVLAAAGPVLLLQSPTHLGNLGAAVRVAAAAELGGVLVTGGPDPWHPRAVRGAAGLQFALPVAASSSLPATDRLVVGLDPGGKPLPEAALPAEAVLAFGTERHGLSAPLARRADRLVAIPMRPGVSSLNLATAVAVVAYHRRC